jgi:hypothetical protein
MSSAQSRAKRFFVDRVIRQAAADGIPLSDAERPMLSWSETDPEFKDDPQPLAAALAAEISDEEYETKIAILIERAFSADCAADPTAKDTWRDNYGLLEHEDHYINIMLARAIGDDLDTAWMRWKNVWGLRAVPFVLMIFAAMLTALWLASAAQPLLEHVYVHVSDGVIGAVWAVSLVITLADKLFRSIRPESRDPGRSTGFDASRIWPMGRNRRGP